MGGGAVNIGALDQRVFLMRKVSTPDGAGGTTSAWTPYDVVWAEIKPMTGREREARGRIEGSGSYTVRIRNRADMLESDAIRWRGRDMNIRFIKNAGPRAMDLVIEAEVGVLA
jgi:SPP1 family predicted phage head-tail adaptor